MNEVSIPRATVYACVKALFTEAAKGEFNPLELYAALNFMTETLGQKHNFGNMKINFTEEEPSKIIKSAGSLKLV